MIKVTGNDGIEYVRLYTRPIIVPALRGAGKKTHLKYVTQSYTVVPAFTGFWLEAATWEKVKRFQNCLDYWPSTHFVPTEILVLSPNGSEVFEFNAMLTRPAFANDAICQYIRLSSELGCDVVGEVGFYSKYIEPKITSLNCFILNCTTFDFRSIF